MTQTSTVSFKYGLQSDCLRKQVRRHHGDELTRGDDLRFLTKSWKVSQVAGDHVIGARGVCAFKEDIIVGITRHLKMQFGCDAVTVILDELQQLLPQTL